MAVFRPGSVFGAARRQLAPAATARRADAQHIARLHVEAGLAGQHFLVAICAAIRAAVSAAQAVLARLARPAPGEAVGRALPPLGEDRHAGGCEELDLAHQPVAPAVAPPPTGAAPQRIAPDPHRQLVLQRLNRGVERVAHVAVDTARAVRLRACARAAAYRLVVGEGLPAARIDPAE